MRTEDDSETTNWLILVELWSSGKNVDMKVDSKSSQLGAVSTWMGDLIRIPTEGLDFDSFFFFFFSFFFILFFFFFFFGSTCELLRNSKILHF